MATETTQMGARPDDPYQLDRRLTILETRFDTILPTLATKADVAELKSELKTLLLGYFLTMVLGFAGVIGTMIGLLRH
ncbi:hypothetical protein NX774_17235 [Massilia agilis]|uniref:DUF1640 domain-containing protein n=1 Tax=Massilia agilis TaxID=1811226 RepID=A0ABT2DEB3_9BURK|nr:hypothetical protein [Massilia agilis]MCS0809668.1 hypothetical protein [Massilia agilis]